MEILAKILAEKSMHPMFKFHWRCEKTKIINLCFADDLMIFSKGDVPTVKLIMEGLEEFSNLSGLTPNPSKSNIYFSGCEMGLRTSILDIAKFKEGTLPVKYLGVPLLTTKLRATDCAPLIDRITKRVKNWTNRVLSYAGRSQLIQSILFSMQVNWSSLFILPKKVIREIESILRAFLWSGSELKTHSAMIAWDSVCVPKNEGGLGFKSLGIWNRAAIAKHVWFLFSGGEKSMWCQWVKSYLLKGKSFWRVKIPPDPSWVWRKLLSLRDWLSPLINHQVGCGDSTFLWYDNWHPLGPLWKKFGDRILYDSCLNSETKVSQIISGHSWKWPIPNSWEIQELISSTPECCKPNPSKCDQVTWKLTTDGKCNMKWPVLDWPDIVTYATKETKGNSLRANILSNAFLCSIYHIWIERNNRVFNKECKPEEVVIKSVIQMGKEAQVEWCESLNCGSSGVRSYIEGTVTDLIHSRWYLICWRYLFMAVLTGSTTMYEQVLDCMGWQRCPDFGDCRPVVSKDLGFSDFGFATMMKFCWSCWFVNNQTCGRLRGRWYCSVLMAACSAFVDTCLSAV
ncbi:uncharacterized protein LOC114290215 [Camellia sinensis]|uniref:uncharacterized protein LOC114290215 n=1 Tax=Camellia sinensis TaxID=4442 RepID=UPI00103581F3|nr:uncharacterized protein LOC114290215 [Camellia sinensis]